MMRATAKPSIIQNTVGLTGRLNQPKRESEPFDVSKREAPSEARVVGNWEMIEAKMTIEIPLPMPCSVMSSPSHIRMMEPAVIEVTARNHWPVERSMLEAVLAKADSFKIKM